LPEDFIKPKLIDKGFTFIAEEPTPIEGYNLDVYAETKHRTIIRKCAFGEIKTTRKKATTIKNKKVNKIFLTFT